MRIAGAKRDWFAMVIVLSLVAGGLSWSAAAQAWTCTPDTSSPAKPTQFTATVNEEGILLQWDAAPDDDKVTHYQTYRGVGEGATPKTYGVIVLTPVYDVNTGELRYPTYSPMDMVDYTHHLEVGQTYVYAVAFGRWDDCSEYHESEQSDQVTVTYQPKE